MPTFPAALDSFTTILSTSYMDDTGGGVDGPTIITAIQTALAALEAKVGIDSSAVTSSIDYRLARLGLLTPGATYSVSGTTLTAGIQYHEWTGVDNGVLNLNPAAANTPKFTVIVIKNAGAGRLILDPSGAETIEYGAAGAPITMAKNLSLMLVGNPSTNNWAVN